MADVRPDLTEGKMREIHDDLVQRIADQQRVGGVRVFRKEDKHKALDAHVVPDTNAIKEYLKPILRKTEVDYSESQRKDFHRKDDDVIEAEAELEEVHGVKGKAYKKYQGTYDWNLRNDSVIARPGSALPAHKTKKKEPVAMIAARHRIRFLKAMPEWKKKIQDAYFSATTGKEREQKLLEVLDESSRLFGDWRKPREPKFSIFKQKA